MGQYAKPFILYGHRCSTRREILAVGFSRNNYKPRDNGHDFRNDAEPGRPVRVHHQQNQERQPRSKIRAEDHASSQDFDRALDPEKSP